MDFQKIAKQLFYEELPRESQTKIDVLETLWQALKLSYPGPTESQYLRIAAHSRFKERALHEVLIKYSKKDLGCIKILYANPDVVAAMNKLPDTINPETICAIVDSLLQKKSSPEPVRIRYRIQTNCILKVFLTLLG